MVAAVLTQRSYLKPALAFLAVVLLPVLAALIYYTQIAAPRYVSEFRYTVRGGAIMQQSGEDAGGALGGASGLVFAGDSFILEDYIESVQSFLDVEKQIPIREYLGRDGGDFVRAYDPSVPPEDLLPFWNRAVAVSFDAVTGITTVDVSLFRPEDAEAVSGALVKALQGVVDSLSRKAREEMLKYVNDQYDIMTNALAESRARLERFRLRNKLFSPTDQAGIQTSIESELTSQINLRQVELRTLSRRAPGSPRISILAAETRALEQQLAAEMRRRAGEQGEVTTSAQLSEYDALQNDLAIARQSYVSISNLRLQAQANAALTQAQLVLFVPPRPPLKATEPNVAVEILKVFAVFFFIWLVGRILLSSIRVL